MENLSAIVTGGHKYQENCVQLAKETAKKLDLKYVRRGNESLDDLRSKYNVEFILVAKNNSLVLDTAEGEFFFHPNMAHLRIKNLRLGKKDNMVTAMGLDEGMSVLDCTLGFGADAIVSSYAVGETGKVTGIEYSPLIAEVVSYGLSHALGENYDIHRAMRGIEVKQGDYLNYLKRSADKSFDVVYFDPMFRHPLKESCNFNPLRIVANHNPVTLEAIKEAMRVARHRVVLKENSRSLEFERLGFNKIMGGKYSKVHYGVIDLD